MLFPMLLFVLVCAGLVLVGLRGSHKKSAKRHAA
jgi:hypothetical protein